MALNVIKERLLAALGLWFKVLQLLPLSTATLVDFKQRCWGRVVLDQSCLRIHSYHPGYSHVEEPGRGLLVLAQQVVEYPQKLQHSFLSFDINKARVWQQGRVRSCRCVHGCGVVLLQPHVLRPFQLWALLPSLISNSWIQAKIFD